MEDHTAPAAAPSLGRGKTIVFVLILLVLCAGLCEWMARLLIPESLNIGRRILLGREDTQLVRMQNTGGNDAQGYTLPYYHPDHSNWRQPMVNLPVLPRRWRWLAHSRLMAILMLNVFYSQQLISAGNWVDHCHLNVEGERQKAAHILEHVLAALDG
ncbi:MAG: hypothetical protein ABR497_01345 [Kiritimatiellia bacterium]|nr:hypothetical protein [Lentisphaerota bacterium]